MTLIFPRAVPRKSIAAMAAALFVPTIAEAQEIVRLDHSVEVAAPREAVWSALTTPQGLASWIAPASNVRLEPGGPYELYFWPDRADDRGMEGTRVLSFVPGEMLSYTGELAGTWVVWRLSETGGETRIDVTSLGAGAEWAARAPYFDSAMPGVLARLAESLTVSE